MTKLGSHPVVREVERIGNYPGPFVVSLSATEITFRKKRQRKAAATSLPLLSCYWRAAAVRAEERQRMAKVRRSLRRQR